MRYSWNNIKTKSYFPFFPHPHHSSKCFIILEVNKETSTDRQSAPNLFPTSHTWRTLSSWVMSHSPLSLTVALNAFKCTARCVNVSSQASLEHLTGPINTSYCTWHKGESEEKEAVSVEEIKPVLKVVLRAKRSGMETCRES